MIALMAVGLLYPIVVRVFDWLAPLARIDAAHTAALLVLRDVAAVRHRQESGALPRRADKVAAPHPTASVSAGLSEIRVSGTA
jgi:hypothetical protein